MEDRESRNIGYPSQFAIFAGITGGGIIISVLAGVIVWLMMQGTAIPHSTDEILNPRYYNVNMVIQVVSTFFIFMVPVYLFALICYRNPSRFMGFNFNINYKQVLLVLLILLATIPMAGALGELNKILPIPQQWAITFKGWETAREAQEAALININSLSKYIISMLVIALAPALFEETFFRGGLQNLLTRWFKGPWLAILITSIIFSLIHLSYYGFLVRFALGFILGLIFFYSGSLWLSILFHFLVNGLQVTALYMASNSKIVDRKSLEGDFPVWPMIPAVIIMLILFQYFQRISSRQKAQTPFKISSDDEIYEWTRHT